LLALRLRGDLQAAEGRGRAIMIVGADDDAASLEATLELAWCLAEELGHSVLLVDGAFGESGMGAALGLDSESGLTHFLAAPAGDPTDLAKLEQPTAHARIAVLPQGRSAGAPTIRTDGLQRLLGQARQRHEFVLVRSSLRADVNRSLAFSAEVDAALLLAVEEQTTWDQITRAQRLLNDCGARRVALVLADGKPPRRPGRG
jgi:Mrp family chromosome partitioning ATPase